MYEMNPLPDITVHVLLLKKAFTILADHRHVFKYTDLFLRFIVSML